MHELFSSVDVRSEYVGGMGRMKRVH